MARAYWTSIALIIVMLCKIVFSSVCVFWLLLVWCWTNIIGVEQILCWLSWCFVRFFSVCVSVLTASFLGSNFRPVCCRVLPFCHQFHVLYFLQIYHMYMHTNMHMLTYTYIYMYFYTFVSFGAKVTCNCMYHTFIRMCIVCVRMHAHVHAVHTHTHTNAPNLSNLIWYANLRSKTSPITNKAKLMSLMTKCMNQVPPVAFAVSCLHSQISNDVPVL